MKDRISIQMYIKTINQIFYTKHIAFAAVCILAACGFSIFNFQPSIAHAAVSDSGLVGYWSFDEGTSTIAHDLSGKGNNGTLSGTTLPTWTNGKLGKALSFNGSSSYISVPSNGAFHPTTDVTVSAWIKPSNQSGYMGIAGAHTSNSYQLFINSNQVVWDIYNVNGRDLWYSGSTDPWNTWSHLVATYTASTGSMNVYINGVPITPHTQSYGAGALQNSASTFLVGWSGYSTEFFNGSIDEVRIYNRALSANDARELYQRGAAKFSNAVSNNGLVGYWSFDEGTSTIAHDFSGNKNNGTLTGSTTIPTWTNGKLGKALSFDGTSAMVSVPFLNPDTLTWSAWIKTSSAATQAIAGTNYGNASTFWHGGLMVVSGKAYMTIGYISSAYQNVSGTKIVNDNKWHHIVMTSNTSGSFLYVDGVQDASSTYYVGQVAGQSETNTNIGVLQSYDFGQGKIIYANYFNGSIDDARLYSRALSATEVLNLYKLGAAKMGTSDQGTNFLSNGLVGYWPFNGKDVYWTSATAGTAYDRSGNGNNGTLTNMNQTTSVVGGKIGQAVKFNGGSDSITLTSSISTGGTNNWSASAWVKTTSSAINSVLSNSSGGPVSNDLRTDSSKIAYAHYDGSWKEELGTSNIADGRWHNLTWVNSSAQTINLYVDGNLENNAAPSVTSNSGPVNQIGRNWYSTANASIDEVRIYNRALSAAEVKALYQYGQSTVKH